MEMQDMTSAHMTSTGSGNISCSMAVLSGSGMVVASTTASPISYATMNKVKKSSKARRTLITAACEECRARKSKCDGTRPSCSRCTRGNKACVYSVNPGETRQAAAKSKTKSLQEDYNSMLEALDFMRSKPLSDARILLDRLRASQNAASFLRSFQAPEPSSSPNTPNTPNTPGSDRRTSDVTGSQDSQSASPCSLVPSIPLSDDNYLSQSSAIDRNGSVGRTGNGLGCDISEMLPNGITFPSEHLLRDCVNQFYTSSGKLFHVLSQQIMESHLNKLYGGGNAGNLRVALCEVCCVAAVGALYMKKQCQQEDAMYYVARALLDEAIQENPLHAAKCCTLLCMFNILNKATVALAYVELAQDLSRRYKIHTPNRPRNLTIEEWRDSKRAWRTITFFGGWIASTLGYVSSSDWMIASINTKDVEFESEVVIADIVQTEMVKIAILKQEILQIDRFGDLSSSSSVEKVRWKLHQWHQELPSEMQLSNLLNNPEMDTALRRSVYYVHLLYLGALMLIYRQMLNQPEPVNDNELESLDRTHVDAVFAAQQSSRILGLLSEEGGIFHRCWICIFQAYSAGTLILHGVAVQIHQQQQQQEQQPQMSTQILSLHHNNMEQARICLEVLGFCSRIDSVARKFYSALGPCYDSLRRLVDMLSSSPGQVTDLDAQLHPISLKLHELARRSFDQPQGQRPTMPLPSCKHSIIKEEGEGGGSSSREYAPCNPQDTGLFGWQGLDEKKNSSIVNTLLNSVRPAQFLDGFMPYGWADDAGTHASVMMCHSPRLS